MFCLASNLELNKESTRNSATNAYGKRGAIQNLLVTPKFEWYWLFQKWTYSKINFFSRKRTSNQLKSLQILSVKLDIWYSTVFRAHFNIKVSFYHLEDHSILFNFKPDLHNLGWWYPMCWAFGTKYSSWLMTRIFLENLFSTFYEMLVSKLFRGHQIHSAL